jgi:hypothetical protein
MPSSSKSEADLNGVGPVPSPAAVREQLKRLLAHPLFANSKRYPVLLAYTVEQTLLGNSSDVCIPRGYYDVTWIETSGSQVQLTIQAKGQKPIKISARRVGVKHSEAGVTAFVDNGVTYLQDFHTPSDTFILSGAPNVRR